MKLSPVISERCRKLNNADINALLAHIEKLESIVSSGLSGPETKMDKPFMYVAGLIDDFLCWVILVCILLGMIAYWLS
ncbi:hypothetical protein LU604_01770 [Erwinia tracheiphila]|uniref:Uncharacterized protein n=1 Tax=Erwinia tracheiphila TaxID=65700 RepID=A0A345CVG9_9GAMM|nr:hypothetical protein [Erwinia tracheiphila]AXF77436.1 hypothetical protein AV903_17585 [Erwinia tracheiphila]UIA83867.1 hypothetical protein LU604_01770 [Erwinia tracheiphila]UIA92449.1 hypothetical protein LU632_01745 [Erwinia tracheiphila]